MDIRSIAAWLAVFATTSFPSVARAQTVKAAPSKATAPALERAPVPQSSVARSNTPEINITLAAHAAQAPVTGRLFFFCVQRSRNEPRLGPDWFSPEPFFAIDVADFGPGTTRRIDERAAGFPRPLSELPAGTYRVQALLDHSLDHHHHGQAPGNFYSAVQEWRYVPGPAASVNLTLDHVIGPRQFAGREWLREAIVASPLLSEFHGRPIEQRAAVVLPASYGRDQRRRYPVVYVIPGFGGTHYDAAREFAGGPPAVAQGETEFIRVLLSGDCKWGHHVFADSATNGPRGEALVREFIPSIDATYRTVAAPHGRLLTGHSSGGWSSLWLQVSYPEMFGGVWSTAPDPVDFRDWQQVDLYADPPLSLYVDPQGARRPIARRGVKPVVWYESFARMDDVIGRGGQLRSFEAVFSPLDDDGHPRRMWDRETGRVDPDVVRAWSKYDIRLKLEREWATLGPLVRGKLHVFTGAVDTFYLEGAVRRLAESLRQLRSDAEVVVLAGRDHRTLLTPDLVRKIRRQMTATYQRGR